MRFTHPQQPLAMLGRRHAARRPVPPGPNRRRHGAVRRRSPRRCARRCQPGTRSTTRSSPSTPTASTRCATHVRDHAVASSSSSAAASRERRSTRPRRRYMRRAERDDRVLGDGPDAAQARGRDDPGDRQPDAAARQHRSPRRGAVSGARPLATCRAIARWASGDQPRRSVPRRARARVRLRRRRASTGSTPSRRSTRCARRRASVFFGIGGNSLSADARHRMHRARRSSAAPDRAGLDEAQPHAPRHRRARR